jgi:hypothetical protein
MGWKWNDVAELLAETGMFSKQQISKVDEIVTQKKWQLVSILEGLAADPQNEFDRGRNAALTEVIAGVKPHGPRP